MIIITNIFLKYITKKMMNKTALIAQIKEKTASQDFIAFSIILALHLFLISPMMFGNNDSNNPVLSFTITMMDVSSSSSNIVASAASTASNSNTKSSTKIEENKNALANANSTVQENLEDNSKAKSKSQQAYNSLQQTAVVAPTKEAVFDAAYLSNAAPSYPPLSRQLEEEGTVILNVFVNENGKTQEIVIKKSTGFSRLDKAAINTVKKWNFIPAKQGDKIISSWVQVPISFILDNK